MQPYTKVVLKENSKDIKIQGLVYSSITYNGSSATNDPFIILKIYFQYIRLLNASRSKGLE